MKGKNSVFPRGSQLFTWGRGGRRRKGRELRVPARHWMASKQTLSGTGLFGSVVFVETSAHEYLCDSDLGWGKAWQECGATSRVCSGRVQLARLLGDSCLSAGVPPLEAKVQVAPRPRRRESS